MKCTTKIYFSFLALSIITTSTLFAQQDEISILKPNKWAVQLNFQHQDLMIDLEFGQLGIAHDVKIRPRYSLEIQRFFYLSNTRLFATAELDYFHNLYHDKWLGLKLGLGAEYQLGNFIVNLRGLGGLARTQGADVQYVYENEKWIVYNEPRDATTDFLLSPRVDLGYRLQTGEHPIDVFINSQMTLYLSLENGLAIPYYGYGFGLRYGF